MVCGGRRWCVMGVNVCHKIKPEYCMSYFLRYTLVICPGYHRPCPLKFTSTLSPIRRRSPSTCDTKPPQPKSRTCLCRTCGGRVWGVMMVWRLVIGCDGVVTVSDGVWWCCDGQWWGVMVLWRSMMECDGDVVVCGIPSHFPQRWCSHLWIFRRLETSTGWSLRRIEVWICHPVCVRYVSVCMCVRRWVYVLQLSYLFWQQKWRRIRLQFLSHPDHRFTFCQLHFWSCQYMRCWRTLTHTPSLGWWPCWWRWWPLLLESFLFHFFLKP